ncbi:MAG: hypothetical protein ACOYOU_16400 [Kiritimatiellia bacterium]
MDWIFYRTIVPVAGKCLMGSDAPDEAVCGGINTCCGYLSGLYLGVWKLGAGRFIANGLSTQRTPPYGTPEEVRAEGRQGKRLTAPLQTAPG